jgi:hypothetical protein
VFTPVLAKHTKSFNLIDTLAVGVDRIQRNFEPLQRQVELWRKTQITDNTARLIFYSAFVDGKLEAPRSLLPEVHRLYFEPQYPEFAARTMWSLSNAFTSAFKKLDPVPQFKATAKYGINVFQPCRTLSTCEILVTNADAEGGHPKPFDQGLDDYAKGQLQVLSLVTNYALGKMRHIN